MKLKTNRAAAARKAWETIRARRGLAPVAAPKRAASVKLGPVTGPISLPCSLTWAGNYRPKGTPAIYKGVNPKLGNKGVIVIAGRETYIPAHYVSAFEQALRDQS